MSLLSAVASRLNHDSMGARLLRPAINRVVPNRPVVMRVLSGRAAGIHLPLNLRHEKFYWSGTWESQVQEVIASVLKPGMVFWDIGAHIGFHTVIASRSVGATGTVCAFEPMPENNHRLDVVVGINRLRNVWVHKIAISSTSETGILIPHRCGASTMWSLAREGDQTLGAIPVTCRSIDDLTDSIPSPDLIKIDVEGAELAIIEGGLKLLQARQPACIVEFLQEWNREEAERRLPWYDFQAIDQANWLLTTKK